MQSVLNKNPYIKSLLQLNLQYPDRKAFHQAAEPLLLQMGKDKSFIDAALQRNFIDEGFLKQKWSLYNIPFFFVYETKDFNLKIHLFPALASKEPEIAASCIHHHNNYMLSSFAFHGSGYETFLFHKNYEWNEQSKIGTFRIRENFHQKDRPVSFVDAWEPHLVFNPTALSATLILWTPDKKRKSDNLRQMPILKLMKKPLRALINAFGLSNNMGIAAKNTFQFYPSNSKIVGIEENEFFEPTKKAVGAAVDTYSIQTIFKFIEEGNYLDKKFLQEMKEKLPGYYQPFIESYLSGKTIEETFAKSEINIPQKSFNKADVLAAMDSLKTNA